MKAMTPSRRFPTVFSVCFMLLLIDGVHSVQAADAVSTVGSAGLREVQDGSIGNVHMLNTHRYLKRHPTKAKQGDIANDISDNEESKKKDVKKHSKVHHATHKEMSGKSTKHHETHAPTSSTTAAPTPFDFATASPTPRMDPKRSKGGRSKAKPDNSSKAGKAKQTKSKKDTHPTPSASPIASPPELEMTKVVFEYLVQCSSSDIDSSSCLVSKTADAILSVIQEAAENGEDCVVPEISKGDLRDVMEDQLAICIAGGEDISSEVYHETVLKVREVLSDDCYTELCEELLDPSELFFKVFFQESAKCAGVELDMEPCIVDHFVQRLFLSNSTNTADDDYYGGVDVSLRTSAGKRARRVLEDTGDPRFDDDAAGFLFFIVMLLLADVSATCTESYVDEEQVIEAAYAFVEILSNQQCMGGMEDDR